MFIVAERNQNLLCLTCLYNVSRNPSIVRARPVATIPASENLLLRWRLALSVGRAPRVSYGESHPIDRKFSTIPKLSRPSPAKIPERGCFERSRSSITAHISLMENEVLRSFHKSSRQAPACRYRTAAIDFTEKRIDQPTNQALSQRSGQPDADLERRGKRRRDNCLPTLGERESDCERDETKRKLPGNCSRFSESALLLIPSLIC